MSKLNLPQPGNIEQRLLFSNINSGNKNHYYLLMTFHKSMKGGFSKPISTDDCKKALKRKGKIYVEGDNKMNFHVM